MLGSALAVAASSFALAAPQPAGPIVFQSDGPAALRVSHRYSIGVDGSGRVQEPDRTGTPSPDGTLVARAGGLPGAPIIEVVPAGGGQARTVVGSFPEPAGIVPTVSDLVWSPRSDRLAIVLFRLCPGVSLAGCGTYELWTARVDGTQTARLARGRMPSWSPDARRLAFAAYASSVSGDAVFVVGATGGAPRLLAAGRYPVWAPRGSLVAYIGPRGLSVRDTSSRRARARVIARQAFTTPPVWSPDATRLAFTTREGSEQKAPVQLDVGNVRTGAVSTLRVGAAPTAPLELPVWSPNGKRIAYATASATYDVPGSATAQAASEQVYVISASGSAPVQVTHELPWAIFQKLGWSADGRQILYTAEQSRTNQQLYAIEPDGSGLVQLTHDLFDDAAPDWSSDGARIAFERTNAYNAYPRVTEPGIYVLDPGSGVERRICPTDRAAFGENVAWSPDGTQLAFVIGAQIMVAESGGCSISRTFATLGQPSHPTWTADSSTIVFSDRSPAGPQELFSIGRDGSRLMQLTSLADARAPTISPDGTWIAFVGSAAAAGPAGTWVMHLDGSALHRVAPTFTLAPAWSPDSSNLVYVGFTQRGEAELHVVGVDGTGDRAILSGFGLIAHPDWRRR